ncbi:hypothetical protein TWF694_009620 [Orbilia ellipsospora]|uniref:Uncharacterized protein n=1 Tax=Orbilia ellipsospora TaxID=2528407 RepID=A0AAV9XBC5_9PEZI
MYSKILIIMANLVALPFILSAPTPGSSWGQPVCDVANFDNYPSVALLTPIGEYKNIFWQAMSVGSGLLQVTGVKPHSGGIVAVFRPNDILLEGTPSMLAGYANGKTDTFDLYSFAYGCSLPNVQGTLTLPTACNITIKGYFDSDKFIERTVTYSSTGVRPQMMETQNGLLSGFRNLKKATFEVVGLLDSSFTATGLLDDDAILPLKLFVEFEFPSP